MKASEFRAKCLGPIDEAANAREALVITKNGEPVATLVPFGEGRLTVVGPHRDPVDLLIAATAEVYEGSLATANRRPLDGPSAVPRIDARS